MKLSKFGKVFNNLYTDVMSIYRRTTSVNTDGTTDISTPSTPLYSDIECRISFSSNDAPESGDEGRNPINLQLKVFCAPSVDVQKGDKIVVSRMNDDGTVMKSYKGTANLPLKYVTHQEILLIESGDA